MYHFVFFHADRHINHINRETHKKYVDVKCDNSESMQKRLKNGKSQVFKTLYYWLLIAHVGKDQIFELETSNLKFHIAFWLASDSLHSLQSVIDRYNLYQFSPLYSKILCCLDICPALLPRIRLLQYQGNVYFIFSCILRYVWTKQVS